MIQVHQTINREHFPSRKDLNFHTVSKFKHRIIGLCFYMSAVLCGSFYLTFCVLLYIYIIYIIYILTYILYI